jgi:cyclohexa-1,5-dienecarbonyl-CoA hydratase
MIDVRRNERVVHLVINAPKVNVLDGAILRALSAHLAECGQDPDVAAVFLSGEGRCFSAGASVAEHRAEHAEGMLGALLAACTSLADLPVPAVALVHGICMGGAMELISFCDFVVADPGATFAQSEIKLAFFPPVACSQLPRIVGLQNAAYLTLTGESVSADRAAAMGLVQRVLAREEWGALDTIFNALSIPALRIAKEALRLGGGTADTTALRTLKDFFLARLYALDDVEEGIRSFEERRSPEWKHR